MKDKEMLLDVIHSTKQNLTIYTSAIFDANNKKIRTELQNMRNNDEDFQYELLKISKDKGYCIDCAKATSKDISDAKAMLINNATAVQGAGPMPLM